MGLLSIEGVTHWSIPVNNLEESEEFYRDLLGLDSLGRLGDSHMACFSVGEHRILICQRDQPIESVEAQNAPAHHSFTVTPETLDQACKVFQENNVRILALYYRKRGFFTGRELYFLDPSGNRLELRDPTWKDGMPEPSYEEVVRAG
jgi:catechol 2,3-dioxygenase-like lactoylglutathione lyase family enzyme